MKFYDKIKLMISGSLFHRPNLGFLAPLLQFGVPALLQAGGAIGGALIAKSGSDKEAKAQEEANRLGYETWQKEFAFEKDKFNKQVEMQEKQSAYDRVNSILRDNRVLTNDMLNIWAGQRGR